MTKPEIEGAIMAYLQENPPTPQGASSQQIAAGIGAAVATVNRYLNKLLAQQHIVRTGQGKATRYRPQLASPSATANVKPALPNITYPVPVAPLYMVNQTPATYAVAPRWSESVLALKEHLNLALGQRQPVTYQRQWVDQYQPNLDFLLPTDLAQALYREGRMPGQLPVSTYARKVLEQLLIDLSWTSSRLEGNRYSLLDTRELFSIGLAENRLDPDAIMLLNHKEAIEFLVETVPTHGLSSMVVRNVHAMLMNNLLPDIAALGAIRHKLVHISESVYLPSQNPHLLQEMLEQIVAKAQAVKNPIEAAFFLWINLAYLQPFEDGNKRTSRVSANIPLLLYNCAPLSFLDIDLHDYAQAMLGVYELHDLSMAQELFAFTYRRSIAKYSVIIESMGAPDPLRSRYRQQLAEAVRQIVAGQQTLLSAADEQNLPEAERPTFANLLQQDLRHLDLYNCSRYRLSFEQTEHWIGCGRPS